MYRSLPIALPISLPSAKPTEVLPWQQGHTDPRSPTEGLKVNSRPQDGQRFFKGNADMVSTSFHSAACFSNSFAIIQPTASVMLAAVAALMMLPATGIQPHAT